MISSRHFRWYFEQVDHVKWYGGEQKLRITAIGETLRQETGTDWFRIYIGHSNCQSTQDEELCSKIKEVIKDITVFSMHSYYPGNFSCYQLPLPLGNEQRIVLW